jgi:hypothetical protein
MTDIVLLWCVVGAIFSRILVLGSGPDKWATADWLSVAVLWPFIAFCMVWKAIWRAEG